MAGEEESSSGCQSGWTVYFNQSYLAPPPLSPHYSKDINLFESPREEELESESESEEEEEDLSMISDASSGPPHFDTEELHSECGTLLNESRKKRKVDRLPDAKRGHFCSSLDDTASSPMLNNHSISSRIATTDIETTAESAPEFSCALSGTYIKEKSVLQKNTGYLQPVANLKLTTTAPTPTIGCPNKRIKRNGDAFSS